MADEDMLGPKILTVNPFSRSNLHDTVVNEVTFANALDDTVQTHPKQIMDPFTSESPKPSYVSSVVSTIAVAIFVVLAIYLSVKRYKALFTDKKYDTSPAISSESDCADHVSLPQLNQLLALRREVLDEQKSFVAEMRAKLNRTDSDGQIAAKKVQQSDSSCQTDPTTRKSRYRVSLDSATLSSQIAKHDLHNDVIAYV